MARIANRCLEIQKLGHSKDRVSMSEGPIAIRHPASLQLDDSNRDVASLKGRTVNPVPISTLSQDNLQRVPAVSKGHLRTIAPSSKQPGSKTVRLSGIQSLLNPVDNTQIPDRNSVVGSASPLGGEEKPLSPPGRMEMISLKGGLENKIITEPHGQHSLAQNYEHSRSVKPEPLQPASRKNSSSTECASYSHFSQTHPALASSIVSTGRPQCFISDTSSDLSSTTVQNLPSANSFELPAPVPAAQRHYQMMSYGTPQGLVQIPLDVHSTSKDAKEKRQRNATASQRFRQRRKEQGSEISKRIDILEARLREVEKQRDYWHDLALRRDIPVEPRTPTPERQRHAVMKGASYVQNQGVKDNGQNGVHTRLSSVPSHRLQPSIAWSPIRTSTFQCIS